MICLLKAQSIDCAYTLEPPRQGGSNEYPQSVFWSKNKNTCIWKPLYTRKIGVQGGIHYKDTQWAHDVKMILTSYQRRCDVMTLHRRRSDVILMSCACWACFWPFSDCSLLRLGSFLRYGFQSVNLRIGSVAYITSSMLVLVCEQFALEVRNSIGS